MKLAVSLICSFLFFSNNLSAQKLTKFYYGDSTISAIGKIENGRPVGLWKSFHENGNLKSIGKWQHNMLDSTWLFYFPNGLLKQKIQYNNGIKNGYAYLYKLSNDSVNYIYKKALYIDGKLHGKQIFYYPNGEVLKFIQYSNNKKTDLSINFDSLGNPESIKTYRNDKPISFQKVNQKDTAGKKGKWIQVDNNLKVTSIDQYQEGKIIKPSIDNNQHFTGKVKYSIEGLEVYRQDSLFKGQYFDSIPVGRHLKFDSIGNPISYTIYDSTGNKIEIGNLKNNLRQGYVTGFYTNGKIKYKGNYFKGYKHGNWLFFYPMGALEQKGKYHYNKTHGKWLWFYKNGDTLRIEHHKQGELDGLYISYDPYGHIQNKGLYYDNLKQEQWIENSAAIRFTGKYFDGKRDGIWMGTYHNGNKAFSGKYVRGKKHGKHINYYSNGNTRKIEFYNFGEPVKHWQYFDHTGKLYKIKIYKKGESLFYK